MVIKVRIAVISESRLVGVLDTVWNSGHPSGVWETFHILICIGITWVSPICKNSLNQAFKLVCSMYACVFQSCLTLCDSMYCSPPGSSVHGILQAGILEWVAISFSRPRAQTYAFCIGRWVLYHCVILYLCAVLSRSVVSDTLRPHGL